MRVEWCCTVQFRFGRKRAKSGVGVFNNSWSLPSCPGIRRLPPFFKVIKERHVANLISLGPSTRLTIGYSTQDVHLQWTSYDPRARSASQTTSNLLLVMNSAFLSERYNNLLFQWTTMLTWQWVSNIFDVRCTTFYNNITTQHKASSNSLPSGKEEPCDLASSHIENKSWYPLDPSHT